MEQEIWVDIFGYEGSYEISNTGRVRSNKHRNKKIMSHNISPEGYCKIELYINNIRKKFYIHRLVMMSFNGYSDLFVNHIDGNKENNNLSNLEYCTNSENIIHAIKYLGRKGGNWNPRGGILNPASKPVVQIDKEGNHIKEYICGADAAKELGVTKSGICNCCKGKAKTVGGYRFKFKVV